MADFKKNNCVDLRMEENDKLPLCGAENVSFGVSVELLGFISSGAFVSIILYGGGGVSARLTQTSEGEK